MSKPWAWRKRQNGVTKAYIWNDTYTVGFLLLAGVDAELGNKLLVSSGFMEKDDPFRLNDDFFACCIRNPKGRRHALVISSDCLKDEFPVFMASLAHECVHLSNHILIPRGIEPTVESDEPQAYFVSWAVKAILETLRK